MTIKNIDIGLLKTFIALAETQNFTHTAKLVHRSQSAVSMQIAKLEEQLGSELFIRNKRNVTLTHDGERLREYANQIVRLSDNLVENFKQEKVAGNVNFASPEDFATYYLPDILATFVNSHPRVTLNVNCNLTLPLIEDFEKGKYDLIVIKQEPGKLYPNSIPLLREELVWVGNDLRVQDLPFSKIKKKYVSRFGYLPLVMSPSPCVYRQRALEGLDKAGVIWKVVYTSPSFAGAIAAVKAGLGFTVFPREMVSNDLLTYKTSRGWPSLKQAEICLLAKDKQSPVIESLVSYISERIKVMKHS
ncbi:MAG: LysR family transcriptional regulator [Gammaproteobacteria bacterium]